MKKLLLITLVLCTSGILSAQQKVKLSGKATSLDINKSSFKKPSAKSSAIVTCGPDTVLYTIAKTTGGAVYDLVGMGGGFYGEGFAQMYEAPQDVTVHGFVFYGRGKTGSVNVNISVYNASPVDSTPVGPAVVTESYVLTNTALTFAALKRVFVFSTPATVSGNYLVAVEGIATETDTFQLVANANGDGADERLSKLRAGDGTVWLDMQDGYGVDVDFLASPIVTYDLRSNFTTANDSVCTGEVVSFTNASSPILNSRFYNTAVLAGTPELSYTWNFDDASPLVNAEDTSHAYAAAGVYNVTLSDTIFGWNMNCASDTTIALNVIDAPVGGLVLSNDTVDATNDSLFVTLSGSSVGNTCTVDFGDGTVISTCTDTFHVYTVAGTYMVDYVISNGICTDTVTDTVVVENPVGISTINANNRISIYPNPAKDQLTFNVNTPSNNETSIFVYSAVGKLVKTITIPASQASFQMSLEELSSGVYYIKVSDQNFNTTQKITIIK
jgi:PKD repeat protein